MTDKIAIRILETDSNRHGDLFCRLMGDLFFALGYEEPRFNVHKSGREIDIVAKHRIENRGLVAECKSGDQKLGGSDINKFVGVLDVERRKKSEQPQSGYIVSLSGFAETAIEQEDDAGGNRVTLLDQPKIVSELTNGRILAPLPVVMEAVGRLNLKGLTLSENVELLAHRLGWFWCVYLRESDIDSAYALIHADGNPVSEKIVLEIAVADKKVGGPLKKLRSLNTVLRLGTAATTIRSAKRAYFKYLESECGEVRLEGLPADQHTGSGRLSLESIFVPLHVEALDDPFSSETDSSAAGHGGSRREKHQRLAIGKALETCKRIALLASPGSGKSTLLKRLAIAYAFPKRRALIKDSLPKEAWLPVVIRCRHILFDPTASLTSIVHSLLPKKAELNESQSRAFRILIDEGLRSGSILLLIDGLDEIGDESQRLGFTLQLRTFLATYPRIGVVITSREAGFRIVGRSLISTCSHFRLAEFDDSDITQLTLAWHKEVVGLSAEIRRDATTLARDIISSNRVRQLAKNPLLLTTLLLVRRWIGQLPSRRSVLYAKAIEVLLMTWNVEAHKPISADEAVPQLAYVAFFMMQSGKAQINGPELRAQMIQARLQLPEILGYVSTSPEEFIRRVENRSSLLIQTGLVYESGSLVPVYEFQHLTFQEYLAALAIVEGYYPARKDDDSPLSMLEPHFADDKWSEVISLTTVLAGRRSREIIERLVTLNKARIDRKWEGEDGLKQASPTKLLGACLVDEVQIPPEVVQPAIRVLIETRSGRSFLPTILRGKFCSIAESTCKNAFLEPTTTRLIDRLNALSFLEGEIRYRDLTIPLAQIKKRFLSPPKTDDDLSVAMAAVFAMHFFYIKSMSGKTLNPDEHDLSIKIGDQLANWAFSENPRISVASIWALAWLGRLGIWNVDRCPKLIGQLMKHWMTTDAPDMWHVCSWAIWSMPFPIATSDPMLESTSTIHEFIKKEFEGSDKSSYRNINSKNRGCLAAAYYAKGPWSNEDMANLACQNEKESHNDSADFLQHFLPVLGTAGITRLAAIQDEKGAKKERGKG